jgi:hypothetical protein
MSLRTILRLLCVAPLLTPLLPVACGGDGVVGGECRAGLKECGGVCIDVANDEKNCGACGKQCAAGLTCVSGACIAGDGAAGSGGDASLDQDASLDRDAGADRDARDDQSQVGDGSDPDVECLPPFNTAAQCGACNTPCTPPNRFCARVGETYDCVPLCDTDAFPKLTECGTQCVDLLTDPYHCGRCFNVCPTLLCSGGQCVGENPGHAVSICSNYAQVTTSHPQAVALGNAVFLPLRNPVRILAYEQYSRPADRNRLGSLLTNIASARGRSFVITAAPTGADVTTNLNILNYDVLLVYDQPTAPDGELGTLGTAASPTILSFLRAGGVAIVLDSGTGTGQMSEFLTNANLLAVSGETSVTGSQAVNRAPGDVIGTNVLSPFVTQRETCSFTTSVTPDSETVFVVSVSTDAGPAAPIIVHRIQTP